MPHCYGKLACHMGSEMRILPSLLAEADTRFSDLGAMQG